MPARRGKQLDDNVRAQFECGNYSWIPTGLSPDQVINLIGACYTAHPLLNFRLASTWGAGGYLYD